MQAPITDMITSLARRGRLDLICRRDHVSSRSRLPSSLGVVHASLQWTKTVTRPPETAGPASGCVERALRRASIDDYIVVCPEDIGARVLPQFEEAVPGVCATLTARLREFDIPAPLRIRAESGPTS